MKSSLLILFTATLFTVTACNRGNTLPDEAANGADSGLEDGAATSGDGAGGGIVESPLDAETRRLMEQLVVYFDYDQAEIRPEFTALLAAHGQYLAQNANVALRLEGHTDERGGSEYNLALGERRAKSALQYLLTLGVKSDRLSIISYGKEKPVDMGHDEAAWSRNRRGNFRITEK